MSVDWSAVRALQARNARLRRLAAELRHDGQLDLANDVDGMLDEFNKRRRVHDEMVRRNRRFRDMMRARVEGLAAKVKRALAQPDGRSPGHQ